LFQQLLQNLRVAKKYLSGKQIEIVLFFYQGAAAVGTATDPVYSGQPDKTQTYTPRAHVHVNNAGTSTTPLHTRTR